MTGTPLVKVLTKDIRARAAAPLLHGHAMQPGQTAAPVPVPTSPAKDISPAKLMILPHGHDLR